MTTSTAAIAALHALLYGPMTTVGDILRTDHDISIITARDEDGYWIAWPEGGRWPRGTDAALLPTGRSGILPHHAVHALMHQEVPLCSS